MKNQKIFLTLFATLAQSTIFCAARFPEKNPQGDAYQKGLEFQNRKRTGANLEDERNLKRKVIVNDETIETKIKIDSQQVLTEYEANCLLFDAAKSFDIEAIKFALTKGANIKIKFNAKSGERCIIGHTLHHLGEFLGKKITGALRAICRGLAPKNENEEIIIKKREVTEIIKFLIDQDADIDTINNDAFTPLMYAIKYKLNEVAWLLIDKKANINITTPTKNSVLRTLLSHLASDATGSLANNAHDNFIELDSNIVKYIIDHADLNIKITNKKRDLSPLFFVADIYKIYGPSKNSAQKMIKMLIEHNADINAKDSVGRLFIIDTEWQDYIIETKKNFEIAKKFLQISKEQGLFPDPLVKLITCYLDFGHQNYGEHEPVINANEVNQ